MNLKELVFIDKRLEMPLYLQIANGLVSQIRRGSLRRGLRLPGSRDMARSLKVHRKTIVAALDELQAQGWIIAVPRKGCFVAEQLPDFRPQRITDRTGNEAALIKANFPVHENGFVEFPAASLTPGALLTINDGFPDVRLAPIDLLLREFRSLSKRTVFRKYLAYGDPAGSPRLVETLSQFLSDTRSLPITTNNIMVTKGAQMGIYLAASVLLRPGDEVIVGEPNYFAANLTFQQLKARLNRVPVDEQGIDVDAIEKLCRKKKIRLLYVIPHHHHPTTVTLTPERRLRLLELATRYRFAIIEDDYDYDFHYSSTPVLPMASLDHHGNTIYIGTLSKTLAPAIRVGFMVAPGDVIRLAARLRRTLDRQGDSMMEAAIAELYSNGTIGRHIKKAVKTYHERRDHFCRLLSE
ncbi:MAG TPA: PLP-dependent aminotransferase family protein, partial [Flavisolibacter sp.]|nr:PLP-dependent aminotransferase family protein [Flavisolibacter sp.]